MLTGCLPVVVAFRSHVRGFLSWWLPGGPPAERMVPFWDAIDYRSFVIEASESEVGTTTGNYRSCAKQKFDTHME